LELELYRWKQSIGLTVSTIKAKLREPHTALQIPK